MAVRDLTKARDVSLPTSVFTDDAADVVADPDIDVVVELIGGIDPARALVLDAIKAGKPVVTGNKALLAAHGAEIFAAGAAFGVDVLFEAAVAGGVPLVRPLRESLLGEPVDRVLGIVNGTTNFILTKMTEEGASYADVLAEAQALGYAEADPTADVEGLRRRRQDRHRRQHRLRGRGRRRRRLARGHHGHHRRRHRVRHPQRLRGEAAGDRRALRTTARSACGSIRSCVPATHPLAAVRDSFNAVFVQGAAVGDLMFYGRGAGGDPTASAVLGDLVDAALNRQRGAHATIGALGAADIRPLDELECEYYLSIDAVDRPGVLATVASVFGDHSVSIASMEQAGDGDGARIVFITHLARERDCRPR